MTNHAVDKDLPEGEHNYTVREAVALFDTEPALTNAVDRLEAAGLDRAEISVLAANSKSRKSLGQKFAPADQLAEDASAPRDAPTSTDSLTEIEAAAVGLPTYVGGVGGMFAVVASGGSLALALPVAIAAGLAGGGLGLVAAYAIARNHRKAVREQLENGGLLLWARTSSPDREKQVVDILNEAGGRNVHVHDLTLRWGIEEMPLAHAQPDPFLERMPV